MSSSFFSFSPFPLMASIFGSLLVFVCFFSIVFIPSSSASSLCAPVEPTFVGGLRSQCPVSIEPSPALEVSGDIIDRKLHDGRKDAYYSILFYASWCPFSRDIRPAFDALSSMFPQIRHYAVEQSSTMPMYEDIANNVFSRYGVHSFPSILLANQTTIVPFRGPKDLKSLVHFYEETTGHEPVTYIAVEQPRKPVKGRPLRLWDGSLEETIMKEPYLVLAFLFTCLKMLVRFLPKIISCLKELWLAHAWCLKMRVFSESSQLLEQVYHIVDVKKLWNKLKLCNKSRNFQKGAKNARVWASSLASVSLGESSSSARLVSPGSS